MIALASGAKAYGGQVLLRDVSWRIGRGERIGLVGPNGAGKTTLCRILAGVEDLDAGQVHLDTGVTVGYLPQEVRVGGDLTVLAEALSGWDSVWKLEAQLEDLAARMAGPDADPSLTETYGEVQHRFEALGGYRLESEAKIILGGLGFKIDELHRPLPEFSGGWRMRAALARLLLLRPDLLLLDEPTNHLDLESLRWLEDFLAAYEGSVVIVSHDRYFLNRMVTAIAELADGAVVVYPGDYDNFLLEREARQALLEARQKNQAKRVAEIERFIERFRYQATKARQVQSRIKMLAKVERIEINKHERDLRAFDKDGHLVAFYPASIGSTAKPAPSGSFKVNRVQRDPAYHYDPKFHFKGVKARQKFAIKPGPNNPVGTVWIDLTAPSYGIHGTPNPDKIGKTESHGCIRLTNWDALALAAMVHKGTQVDFVE